MFAIKGPRNEPNTIPFVCLYILPISQLNLTFCKLKLKIFFKVYFSYNLIQQGILLTRLGLKYSKKNLISDATFYIQCYILLYIYVIYFVIYIIY